MMIITVLSCSNNSKSSQETIKDPIYVGIDVDFPPFGYLDNGNIAGFDYDIMSEALKLAGINGEFVHMQFSGLLPALQAKKIVAVVFDKEPCKNFEKYNDDIKLIESDAIKEDYAIAVRKEDTLLLQKINEGLSQIMTNGTYEKLIEKNFK